MGLAEEYPKLSARRIRELAGGELEKRGVRNLLPGQRKVDDLVRKARYGDDPLEEPWGLATLSNERFRRHWPPLDATNDLLEVWG